MHSVYVFTSPIQNTSNTCINLEHVQIIWQILFSKNTINLDYQTDFNKCLKYLRFQPSYGTELLLYLTDLSLVAFKIPTNHKHVNSV